VETQWSPRSFGEEEAVGVGGDVGARWCSRSAAMCGGIATVNRPASVLGGPMTMELSRRV
jgi:hypothetical protein